MINLKVTKHDGEVFYEDVENYNPVALNQEINDSNLLTVVIGMRIISRISIADISIVSE